MSNPHFFCFSRYNTPKLISSSMAQNLLWFPFISDNIIKGSNRSSPQASHYSSLIHQQAFPGNIPAEQATKRVNPQKIFTTPSSLQIQCHSLVPSFTVQHQLQSHLLWMSEIIPSLPPSTNSSLYLSPQLQ